MPETDPPGGIPLHPDILDVLQESVVQCDADGRITGWNLASAGLYGWTAALARGRPVHAFLETPPDIVARIAAGLAATGQWDGDAVRQSRLGVPVSVRLRCVRQQDGGIVETAIPVDGHAPPPLGSSEERSHSLFHFLPVALIQLDRTELAGVFARLREQGITDLMHYFAANPGFYDYAANSIRVIEVNPRAVELFKAADEAQLLGPAARIWSEAPDIIQQSMAARFSGAPSFEAQMKIRTFSGELREVLYVAYFPEAFSPIAVGLSCLVDIDERVKAQAMLAQVQAEFAHAARVSMLGELTASIAHEVNQPLGAILTNGEAALRWLDRPEPDLEELRALSTRTVADAYRAADIIRRIRNMATRGEPEQVPLSLAAVIEEVLLFLRPELRHQRVEVSLALTPNLPEIIGDRVQLQQVVANLAVNAMHAMADGDGRRERRLSIRTGRLDTQTVFAEVEDTGPGIAADDPGRLFESFFTTKAGGMGIGLTICRSIIEAHGGRITATNRAEGGACFRFTLPLATNHTDV